MQILNFQDENDGSVTKAAILEDVEKVSPIRFYAQTQIETKKDLIKTIMVNSCPEFENLPVFCPIWQKQKYPKTFYLY